MKDVMPSTPDVMPEVKGVVIPIRPTWDKITALWLIFRQLGKQVPIVSESTSVANDPKLDQWRKLGYYLLDVGENKYQTRRTGSAVETVCRDFGITDTLLLSLVAIANRNNATGYMKSYSPQADRQKGEIWKFNNQSIRTSDLNWSCVWMLRDAYKVGVDVNQVILHVFGLLDAWLDIQQGNANLERWELRLQQSPIIQELWAIFGSPRLDTITLFSVPTLVWSLAVLGQEHELLKAKNVRDQVQWWLDIQRLIIEERIKARQWAEWFTSSENLQRLAKWGHHFDLEKCPGMKGVFVSCTEVQARELWGQRDLSNPVDNLMAAIFGAKKATDQHLFDLVITRDPVSKEVAILAGKIPLDLSEVFARLRGKDRQIRSEKKGAETKVWHLDVKGAGRTIRHQLLNGSPGWPLPPTQISTRDIINIVAKATTFF
ncbi:MAG: hypothetical protein A2927_02515 [Candidatus Komeilibacteria bacterium RIFCSPLOWO2_01_FULL_45_10]|uniref:Uncharacterized protein n=1 Tax=Candidatus Komeilibacteria bacterium RIFCSPLOWO2_01_FULL_45_10 TaxID=1798550 RepID=A0A1G2BKP9_9BACT|nr:MAG: hypothetical protein A2927_02515 [Candidatus Komeilibacteria bacterium RIFCSPLOWO2_01_FULL_45_10]